MLSLYGAQIAGLWAESTCIKAVNATGELSRKPGGFSGKNLAISIRADSPNGTNSKQLAKY